MLFVDMQGAWARHNGCVRVGGRFSQVRSGASSVQPFGRWGAHRLLDKQLSVKLVGPAGNVQSDSLTCEGCLLCAVSDPKFTG